MSETKGKIWVKKPSRVKNTKPARNRCNICNHPSAQDAHDGCIRRQQRRAKRSVVKMKEAAAKAKTTEVVSEEAKVKAEEKKQAAAKLATMKDEDIVGTVGE